MDVTPGAPYVAFIGATAVGILPHERTLPGLADRREFLSKDDVPVDVVMKGKDRDEDTSTFESFGGSLFLASWKGWNGRDVDTKTANCIEIELRKVSAPYSCLEQYEGYEMR